MMHDLREYGMSSATRFSGVKKPAQNTKIGVLHKSTTQLFFKVGSCNLAARSPNMLATNELKDRKKYS
jgi:hypothetical protein